MDCVDFNGNFLLRNDLLNVNRKDFSSSSFVYRFESLIAYLKYSICTVEFTRMQRFYFHHCSLEIFYQSLFPPENELCYAKEATFQQETKQCFQELFGHLNSFTRSTGLYQFFGHFCFLS